MSFQTYSDLKGAIQDWVADSSVASRLGDFVTLSEQEMQRELNALEYEAQSTITGVADQANYDYPSDFKIHRNLSGSTSTGRYDLKYRTPVSFDRENVSGYTRPGIFTFKAGQLWMGPSPVDSSEFILDYVARFTPLSDAAPTNYLLTNFPDMYFYGGMAAANHYKKDWKAHDYWHGKFMKALQDVNWYLWNQKIGSPPTIRSA